MDVIVPAHNLRTLSTSLTTLSKIGKYLYVEFDPLSGLIFRTLNDAKSSYAQFTFDVGFFERCTTPPGSMSHLRRRVRGSGRNNRGTRARTHAHTGNNGTVGRRIGRRRRKRNRSEQSTRTRSRMEENGNDDDDGDGDIDENGNNNNSDDNDGDDNDDDDDDVLDEKYFCRVNIKTVAAILTKSRRGVQSLRIRSLGLNNNNTATNDNGRANTTSNNSDDDNHDNNNNNNKSNDNDNNGDDNLDQGVTMQLSFEFRIQSDGIMRLTHKVAVSEADSVVAVAHRTACSEIVVAPRVLMKLMDPVKSTETAMILSDVEKKVTATSFHYADVLNKRNNNNMNVTSIGGGNLNVAQQVLKTETSIGSDDFDEFLFSDGNGEEIPEGADKEVALVFSTKEAKAMLHFCAQTDIDDDLRAIVSFYWGGRPIIIETEGDAFKGELILATVPHDLLQGVDLTSRSSRSSTGANSSRKNRQTR